MPAEFTDPVTDPLGELLGRYARTRAPFCTADAAARFRLGLRVAGDVLARLAVDGRLIRGEFTDAPTDSPGAEQWCDAGVLRVLRRRSLAALRAQIEPVSTAAYARFLPAWQQFGAGSGPDGLLAVIDQLAGVPLAASAVEPLIFGQRVRDYSAAMLDELLASGRCCGPAPGRCPAATAGSPSTRPTPPRPPWPPRRAGPVPGPHRDPGRAGRRRRVLLPAARSRGA